MEEAICRAGGRPGSPAQNNSRKKNTPLKQLVADLTLDKAMLQGVLSKKI